MPINIQDFFTSVNVAYALLLIVFLLLWIAFYRKPTSKHSK